MAMSFSVNTNTSTNIHSFCYSRHHGHCSLFIASSHVTVQLRTPPASSGHCSLALSSFSHWLPITRSRRVSRGRNRRSSTHRICALADATPNGSSNEGAPNNATISKSRREMLLEYVRNVQPEFLELFVKRAPQQELTSSAGEDALEAMNTFIQRLLGVSDVAQLKRAPTETTAPELARLLYWLMVVGYSIRNIEVRFDMERVLGMPPKLAELPPGENL